MTCFRLFLCSRCIEPQKKIKLMSWLSFKRYEWLLSPRVCSLFIFFWLTTNELRIWSCPKINKRELVELNIVFCLIFQLTSTLWSPRFRQICMSLTKKSIMTFSWMCFYEVIDEPPVVKFLTFVGTLTTTPLIFKKVWLVSFLYFLICLFI